MQKKEIIKVPLGIFQFVLDCSKAHAWKMLNDRATDTRDIKKIEDEIIAALVKIKSNNQKSIIVKQKPPRTKKQIEVNADQVQFLATK